MVQVSDETDLDFSGIGSLGTVQASLPDRTKPGHMRNLIM